MTTSRRIDAAASGAEVRCIGTRAIEFRMGGHVSRRILEDCLGGAVEVLQQHPEIHTSVWDFEDLTSYDPGNPALAIRWTRAHMPSFTHSVVVTRSHVIAGLVRVGQVMLPWIKAEVVSRRQDVPMVLDEILPVRRPTAA